MLPYLLLMLALSLFHLSRVYGMANQAFNLVAGQILAVVRDTLRQIHYESIVQRKSSVFTGTTSFLLNLVYF
jgi:hypothetical protein